MLRDGRSARPVGGTVYKKKYACLYANTRADQQKVAGLSEWRAIRKKHDRRHCVERVPFEYSPISIVDKTFSSGITPVVANRLFHVWRFCQETTRLHQILSEVGEYVCQNFSRIANIIHLRTNVWVAQHVTDGRGVVKGDLRGPNELFLLHLFLLDYNIL